MVFSTSLIENFFNKNDEGQVYWIAIVFWNIGSKSPSNKKRIQNTFFPGFINFNLRVVETLANLFLKSMSERGEADIERL